MDRIPINRHALGAVVLCALALAAACLLTGGSPGHVSGSAISAGVRATASGVAPAPDATFPVGGPSLTRAREIADAHWGSPACGGEVVLEWTQLEADVNATASWRNPTHAWDNAGENFDCRVQFNVRAEFDWPKLCSVMAHEMGHLLGAQHTAAGDELMSPVYAGPLAMCSDTRDPAAPSPSPSAAPVPVPRAASTTARLAGTLRSVARRPAMDRAARRRAARCAVVRRVLARQGRRSHRCGVATLRRRSATRSYQSA